LALVLAAAVRRLGLGVPGALLVVGPVVGLAVWMTRVHTAVYRDEPSFWADAFAKSDQGSRSFQAANILSNQGLMLRRAGQPDAALVLFERAMACEYPTPVERLHYAVALAERGRAGEAEPMLRAIAAEAPRLAEAKGALANVLLQAALDGGARPDDARLRESETLLRAAVDLDPGRATFHNTLGYLLAATGRKADAEASYRRAVALEPRRPEAAANLVQLLLGLERVADAEQAIAPLLAAAPADASLRLHFAGVFLRARQQQAGIRLLRDVLRIDPTNAQARAVLAEIEAGPR
jgi:Tfp pilus assembly protein PilF